MDYADLLSCHYEHIVCNLLPLDDVEYRLAISGITLAQWWTQEKGGKKVNTPDIWGANRQIFGDKANTKTISIFEN